MPSKGTSIEGLSDTMVSAFATRGKPTSHYCRPAPTHYPNQCWCCYWTHGNKLQWYFNRISCIIKIHLIYHIEMAATVSLPQCNKSSYSWDKTPYIPGVARVSHLLAGVVWRLVVSIYFKFLTFARETAQLSQGYLYLPNDIMLPIK